MEETLTLTRVIENINYVYGEKLVKSLFLFVLLEIVALVFIAKQKPEWINYFKFVVLFIATIVSLVFLSRSRIQEWNSKLELNDTTCAFKEVYDDHGTEHRTKVDGKIYDQHYIKEYGVIPDTHEEFDLSVVCDEKFSTYLLQVMACSLVFIVGFICTKCVFGNKKILLPTVLAPIIGASVIVVMTLFFIICHIPYCLISVFLFLAVVAGVGIRFMIKNSIKIDGQCIVAVISVVAIITIATVIKFYRLAGDARWQVLYARDLVTYHYLQEPFFSVATYGFLGVSLHAFANLFSMDMLYAYFFVIGLSVVAVVCLMTRELLEGEKKKWDVYLFLAFGILFLGTNFDYLYYLDWILSNCAVGLCILSIAALTYLNIKKNMNITLLIALLSFIVLTTRIEGVCYVALLMSVPFSRTGELKEVNIIVGIEIIVWQIVQFLLTTGVGQDGWTPTKGVGLTLVGILIVAESYIVKINFIERLMKHYVLIYIFLLIGIVIFGFMYDSKMASDNAVIFLSHFTVSKYSNSLAFWGFIIVLLPLSFYSCYKEKDDFFMVFIYYILLVFGISIFRTGNPLHTGIADSFRRVLCQAMPLAVWSVSYYAGKCKC